MSGEGDLRFRLGRADLDHRLPLQQIYARPGCRFQQSRHPLSRRRRRFVQPLQDLHPGTSAAGQCLRRPARLAGRRLLREREAARSPTTSATAPTTPAMPTAWSRRILPVRSTGLAPGARRPASTGDAAFDQALVASAMRRSRRAIHAGRRSPASLRSAFARSTTRASGIRRSISALRHSATAASPISRRSAIRG